MGLGGCEGCVRVRRIQSTPVMVSRNNYLELVWLCAKPGEGFGELLMCAAVC